jgi:hypothetical protein
MKLKHLQIVVLLLALGAAGSAQQKPEASSITTDLSRGASFTFTIAPNQPDFTFRLIPDPQPDDQYGNAHSTVRDIEVCRGGSRQPFQHLEGCEFVGMEAPPRGASDWFRAVDMNFDGYNDIYLLLNWGATGNQYGCAWLFDPANGRFEFSKEFSDLPRFQLDPATKTILTFDKGGMAGMIYFAQKYKVEGNRLELIWTQTQDWDVDKKQFHCVVKQRRGGAMALTKDAWGTNSAGEGPCDPGELFRPPPAKPKQKR